MNISNSSYSDSLNCTTLIECTARYIGIDLVLYKFLEAYIKMPTNLLIFCISLVGTGLNLTCFIALRECTCEFNQFLSIFTINSFILNANDLLTYLLLLLPMTANFGYWFYAFSVYSPVNSICYTFGGFLDILIMFERLQLFSKRFKLFSKLSAKQWSATFFVISLFVVVPIKVYLTPLSTTVVFNSNETSEIYKTGAISDFKGQNAYVILYYASIFLRDILPLFLEVTLNLALFIQLKSYLKRKSKLLSRQRAPSKALLKNFKKCDENNTRLAILMCLLSAATHILSLVYCVALVYGQFVYVQFSKDIFMTTVAVKHAINFFIFYKFNKIFKLYFRKSILNITENMSDLDKLF